MTWLFAIHVLGIVVAAALGRSSIRPALLAAAVPGAAVAAWAAVLLIRPTTGDTPGFSFAWVEGLDLVFAFSATPLALLMSLLVGGIGALVFVYASGYFSPDADGGSRFPATLLAFATSMLGLVWAANVWTFFIFWEFTSVTSFLLVGHKHTYAEVRKAARRALLITGAGGLALLAGLLLLAGGVGSTELSALVGAEPPASTAAVAAVLILIGAATKSAQVPFHVWLPGAMAAPTPVSAYLHSATMVKAGVLLVAVAGPAFAGVTTWKVVGLGFGIASMLWGAIGALRQRDAKLILAWGTVSQLGLLITLFSLGTAKATFAAVSLLFAHALFKATLFLVVGEVDVRTGTRDVDELQGLRHSMPVAFWVAVAAAASMAGAPPLLGFAAKEAAVEAVLKLHGLEAVIVAGSVIGGAALTVAYTVRFVLGTFGGSGTPTEVAPRRVAMTAPAVVLAVAGVVGFVLLGAVNDLVRPAAEQLDAGAVEYKLYRYHGVTPALLSTIAAFAVGVPVGTALARRTATQAPSAPRPIGADTADNAVDRFLAAAPRMISVVQHGSLPVYLVTMTSVAIVATIPFWGALTAEGGTDHLVLTDTPIQAALALLVAVAALALGSVRSRLDAALALGAVGVGMTGLFVVHGAPDLALTQLLVETVIVIGFVGGLARLGRRFPPVGTTWRGVRVALAAVSGIAVTGALAAAGSRPTGVAPVRELADGAYETGGGKNVVNVILTDIRALDTLGEVVVLVAVALGVLALSAAPIPSERLGAMASGGGRLDPESTIVRLGVALVSPAAVVVGLYLLFAGHNRPGGGFAAGLVLGAVVTLRALAGLAIPRAVPLLGGGTVVVALTALAPVLWGDGVLDQALRTFELPIFGSVKVGTALPFDIGVTAVVVGLISGLLDGLGDEIEDLERLEGQRNILGEVRR